MSSERLLPRILALNLLKLTLQDCVRPLATKWDQVNAARRDAADFLFSAERQEDLKMWCSMADVNYHTFMKRAKEVYDNKIDISKVEAELAKSVTEVAVEDEDDGI
jgi:hypothetical protein